MRTFLTLKCCHGSPSIGRQRQRQRISMQNTFFVVRYRRRMPRLKETPSMQTIPKQIALDRKTWTKAKLKLKYPKLISPVWLNISERLLLQSYLNTMFQVQITNYMSTASLPRSKSGWTQFSFSLESYSEPLRSIHQLHARVLLQSFCSFSGGVECPLKKLYFRQIYIFHPEKQTLSASGQYPK